MLAHRRRRNDLALRLCAAVAAVAFGAHGVYQLVQAHAFWRPCGEFGYLSSQCDYLQYQAPSPEWIGLFLLWPAEALAAGLVFALAIAAYSRVGFAAAALGCVLSSNLIFDYIATPIVNGGFTSADNPPGFGMTGAVLLIAASAFLVLVAALPSRMRRATASAPVAA